MKTISQLIVLLLLSLASLAQEQTQTDQSPRRMLDPNLFFGGNLALSFGSTTSIDVSPLVGYRLLKQQLALGLGLSYQYYNASQYSYQFQAYGGRVFAQFSPERLNQLILHAEYEYLHFKFPSDATAFEFDSETPFLGAGYRIRMGSRSYSTVMFLWAMNNNPLYQNPIVRVGFTF